MDGWIKLHRKLALNELWKSEPFSRGQAWVDLLILANHKPGFIRKQGLRIDLGRGDVGWSENELADRWQWSRGKVRRFLTELSDSSMILRKNSTIFDQKTVQADVLKTDKRKFIITILNYDKYQVLEEGDGTSDGTSDSTSDGQATDKRRYKNKNDKNEKNKKKNKDNIPHGENRAVGDEVEFYLTKKKRKLTGKRLSTFNQFWDAFGYFKGKAEAADAWFDIPILTSALVETILDAARREAMARPSLIANGKSPKWAQGWITARRWEDEQDDAHELTPEEQTARDIAEAKRLRAQGVCQ
ncbi:MAG: hypothetical protein V3573_14605 [Desulfovibrionaceae bacterium]